MMRLNKIIGRIVSLVLCSLVISAQAADDFPGVKKLMTSDEYKSAGLEKLSDQELAELNKWLIRYTAKDALVISKTVESVREESNAAIESNILGTFTGWDGSTVFRLANGQVWKQRKLASKRRWRTNLEAPKVIIDKNLLGYFQLTVVGPDKTTKVKRIR